MDCPLCEFPDSELFHEDHYRAYRRCHRCQLVFVPAQYRLGAAAEKQVYDQHQNDPTDVRYRAFLARLFDPVAERVPLPASGLDFGAGPGPTLSLMFEEAGYFMQIYDAFYARQPQVLQAQYDFITASEVAEHLYRPAREFRRLWTCLRPGGLLAIMTRRTPDRQAFVDWHYKNDPTHVCFYAEATLGWLAGYYGATTEFVGEDVVLLHKPVVLEHREGKPEAE